MKVIVTGASGQLGGKVRAALATSGFEVLGLCHTRRRLDLSPVDIADRATLTPVFTAFEPDVVVHAAAVRDPDLCEENPYLAKKVNTEGTENVLAAAREVGARVLFISSDYVFDGSQPPYREASRVRPLNYYGRTKLEGEKAVRADNERRHLILRLPLLYTRDDIAEASFLSKTIDAVRAVRPVKLDHRHQRYPTLVDDVARAIILLAVEELSGTYHFSGNERMTRYEAAKKVGELLELDTGHLEPELNPKSRAQRPLDSRLDCAKIDRAGLGERTPFSKAVWDFWRQYREVLP